MYLLPQLITSTIQFRSRLALKCVQNYTHQCFTINNTKFCKKNTTINAVCHNPFILYPFIESSFLFSTKNFFSSLKKVGKNPNRIQGSVLRMRRMAGRPEFHCIDRDRHGHIIEPTDVFMLVLTTSKNNVHAQIVDRSKNYKTIFGSFAGNVGFRKAQRKTERCAYRIGENIARKCKRLGIFVVDIKFRRVMRIDAVLQALQALGLKVRQLIHEPKIPKTSAHAVRPRRRRRV